MKRWFAACLCLAFAGCSGIGAGTGRLLPVAGSQTNAAPDRTGRIRAVDVFVTMRVPDRHRRERSGARPSTISPLTRSVGIAINGGGAKIFNATPSSPNCSHSAGGTTCTFVVKAPPGNDSFVVTTYSAVSGGGTPLNRGTALVRIVAGKANTARVRLGPAVTTAADTGAGSLRYAVASANPGDTVMFLIPSSSTIKVNSTITLNANVSIAGPGVKSSGGTFTGITVSGQGTQQIFVVKAGVTAAISGLILTKGLATTTNQPGGALYSEGTVTLNGDAFVDNGSQVFSPYAKVHRPAVRRHRPNRLHPHVCPTGIYYAGAVYNHGVMSITGSAFDRNVLQNTFGCGYSYGGAIYNDSYGTLVSSGNRYTNNSAYYGGAVYNSSAYGQASFTGDTFTANSNCGAATGCPNSGCGTPTAACSSYPTGEGGALMDDEGPGVTIKNSTFGNNVSGGPHPGSLGYGGAIYTQTGSPSITGSVFTGNQAGGGTANCSIGSGGAIYGTSDALELDDDTFTNNSVGGDEQAFGGAVYNTLLPVNGSGNKFTSNRAISSGSACANGNAIGGAIYAASGITMSASTFSSNSAKANYNVEAGAVYEHGVSLLSSDTFTSNSVVATGALSPPSVEAYGGAIYFDAALRLNGSTFTGNTAIAQGAGGRYAQAGAVFGDDTLTSSNNTFASNSAAVAAGTSSNADGGAVYSSGSMISNGDKFSSNSVTAKSSAIGGAVYISQNYGLTNGTFTSNKATATEGSASGGALSLQSPGQLSNSTFTGNSATSIGYTTVYAEGGGAIDDETFSTLNGLKITGNSVTGGVGGGIYSNNTDTIDNSVISGNTSSGAGDFGGGGGIWSHFGTTIDNSTLSNNSAAISGNDAGGGAIYVDDYLTITGSTISGNKVTGTGVHSGGGGVFSFGNGTFTNVTIANNGSSVDGGGFEQFGSYAVSLDNVTLYQNAATGKGGNVFDDASGAPNVTLANTIVAGGAAANGKDVYNSGTMVSADYNIFGTLTAGGGTFALMSHDKTANPKLLGLANNGGPTFTNADQSISPGRAYIPWTSASGGTCGAVTGVAVDQRSFTRGAGGKCDVGAYEFAGSPSVVRVVAHPKPVHARRKLP